MPTAKTEPRPKRTLRAATIKALCGLSYRQIHDWDTRGALPGQESRRGGWRTLTVLELFSVSICAQVRERFGIPVKSLRFVAEKLCKEQPKCLEESVRLMSSGFSVWLVTDLKTLLIIDSDAGLAQRFEDGGFMGDDLAGLTFLRLNALVNDLLALLPHPAELKAALGSYELLRHEKSHSGLSDSEREIIGLIRAREYTRVTVEQKHGETMAVSAEQEIALKDERQLICTLSKLATSEPFQTLTVKRHGGATSRLTQTIRRDLARSDLRQQQSVSRAEAQRSKPNATGSAKRKR